MIHFWRYILAWARLAEGVIGVLTFGVAGTPECVRWAKRGLARTELKAKQRRQQQPTLYDLNAFPWWKRN